MLFKNKKCFKCNREYEEVLDECPHCFTPNKDYVELGIPKKLIMLPWLNQIGLFAIGLIGLVIFQILFSIIFSSALGQSNSLAILLSNVIPYILIVLALLFSLITFRKKIFNSFKKPYDFLIGFGFGMIIIGISYLYTNVFLESLNIGSNNNQSTFEMLVTDYPVLTLLIFGIVAPTVEELTYRVGLFSLGYRVNKYVAYVIVIIIFGFIHFDFEGNMTVEFLNLPTYMIAGLLFCLAYRFSGFAGCLTAHTVNNVFSIVATIIMMNYGK